MRSGFFNSNIEGYDDYGNPIYDRAEEASFFAEYFASFIGNGVYPNPSVGMQVIADNGLEIMIEPGKCFIKGYFGKVEEGGEIVTLESSDTSYSRIDRVVARLTIEERKIKLAVLKGVPSSSPVAPDLTRNSNIYEICLAEIAVNKNVSVITQTNITDTRLNTAICGIVSGVVEQVDTSDLFKQYKKWFEEQQSKADTEYQNWFDAFTVPSEEKFTNWFNSMKEQLSEDAAGNLQNQINELTNKFNSDVKIAIGIDEPQNNEDVWFQTKSENLFDEKQMLSKTAIDEYGVATPNDDFNVSNYVAVKAGDILNIKLKSNGLVGGVNVGYMTYCFYNASKEVIRAYQYEKNSLSIPINQDGYFRISYKKYCTVEIYKNTGGAIFLKDNGVYVPFANLTEFKTKLDKLQPNIFSKKEVEIGVDADGKKVYRREFYVGDAQANQNYFLDVEISPDLDRIKNLYGGLRFLNTRGFLPWNYYNVRDKKGTGLYYAGTAFNYSTDYAGTDGLIIVEYTKTTD